MQESERDDFFQEWMFDNEQMFKDKAKEKRREDVAVVRLSMHTYFHRIRITTSCNYH